MPYNDTLPPRLPPPAPMWDKLQQLWLAGHTPDEAFKITNAGMTRRMQNAGFALAEVSKLFALWEREAKGARDVMVYNLLHIRDHTAR